MILRSLCIFVSAVLAASTGHAGTVSSAFFGTRDGQTVEQVTLTNDNGMIVRVMSLGATITDVIVPDRAGKPANVVLGFGNFPDWNARLRETYFGPIVGRFAGRIEGARFSIDGKEVRLAANDGPNSLHGGSEGMESRIWSTRTFEQPGAVGAELSYISPSGEQGYPGDLSVKVTYRLTDDNQLRLDYEATTTEPTALNLTNHAYFNLAGAGSGPVTGHHFQIFAGRYVAVDRAKIPTGELPSVAGTVFDFRRPKVIGKDMEKVPPLLPPGGYDHSWFLDKPEGELGAAAAIHDPVSGRTLQLFTSEPTLHIYTADHLDGSVIGAQGVPYGSRAGFALETQHVPNSPNRPQFPSTLLRPGETYRSTTIFRFGTDAEADNSKGESE